MFTFKVTLRLSIYPLPQAPSSYMNRVLIHRSCPFGTSLQLIKYGDLIREVHEPIIKTCVDETKQTYIKALESR